MAEKPSVTQVDERVALREERWRHAISRFEKGTADELCAAIDALPDAPDFARKFLKNFTRRKAPLRRGAPTTRTLAES